MREQDPHTLLCWWSSCKPRRGGGPSRGGLGRLTLDSLRSAHRLCGPRGRGGAWESRERPPTARFRLLRCDSCAGRVGIARRCVDAIHCGRVDCASRAPVTPERHAPSAGLYGPGALGSGSAVDWNGYPLGSLLSCERFPRGACACRGHPPRVAGVAAVRVRPHCRTWWRLWSEPVFRVLAAWPQGLGVRFRFAVFGMDAPLRLSRVIVSRVDG
jgi:hypothetical protein